MIRDTTSRKRREGLQSRQKAILEMIATGKPLDTILAHICQMVENQIEGMYCTILLLDGIVLRHGAAPSLPKSYTKHFEEFSVGPKAGFMRNRSVSKRTCYCFGHQNRPPLGGMAPYSARKWIARLLVNANFFCSRVGVGHLRHVLSRIQNPP